MRIQEATGRIVELRGHPAAGPWRALGAALGPDVAVPETWSEHESRIRAWVKAAKKIAQPLAKAGTEPAALFEALDRLTRAIRRHPDESYQGIEETITLAPMFVGASRVTTRDRFGWVEDRAAAATIDSEAKAAL